MFSLKPKEGGSAMPTPSAAASGNLPMKIALVVCIVAIAAVGYSGYSTRVALEEKIAALEKAERDRPLDCVAADHDQRDSPRIEFGRVGSKRLLAGMLAPGNKLVSRKSGFLSVEMSPVTRYKYNAAP